MTDPAAWVRPDPPPLELKDARLGGTPRQLLGALAIMLGLLAGFPGGR